MMAEHQEYVAACEELEEIVQHVTDNTLERYAMRTLPRHKIGPLEEHLLICSDCRNRLESENRHRDGPTCGGNEGPGR